MRKKLHSKAQWTKNKVFNFNGQLLIKSQKFGRIVFSKLCRRGIIYWILLLQSKFTAIFQFSWDGSLFYFDLYLLRPKIFNEECSTCNILGASQVPQLYWLTTKLLISQHLSKAQTCAFVMTPRFPRFIPRTTFLLFFSFSFSDYYYLSSIKPFLFVTSAQSFMSNWKLLNLCFIFITYLSSVTIIQS